MGQTTSSHSDRYQRLLFGPTKNMSTSDWKIYSHVITYLPYYKKALKDKSHVAKQENHGKEEAIDVKFSCNDFTPMCQENIPVCIDASNMCHQNDTKKSLEEEPPLFIPKKILPALHKQQTFNMWKVQMDLSSSMRKARLKRVIYLVPLETFPPFIHDFTCGEQHGFFEFLVQFSSAYFSGYDIRLLPAVDMHLEGWDIRERRHKKTGERQYFVQDIQRKLKAMRPKDGYCILGITWTDLYPTEDLNFVLGEANATLKTAVFCFGRFEPKAYIDDKPPARIEAVDGALVWKMIRVITHETSHIFGLAHCVYFKCQMNESHSVQEAINQPLFLCPICLHKIQMVCKFPSLKERYEKLKDILENLQTYYPDEHILKSITWLSRCLGILNSANDL